MHARTIRTALGALAVLVFCLGHFAARIAEARPAADPDRTGPILCANPATCGINPGANRHALDTTAFAYSNHAVSLPAFTFTALGSQPTMTCTNVDGCTIELDATVTIRQTSEGQNAWALLGIVDNAYMTGPSETAGDTLTDGNDSTVSQKQYLAVAAGTHTVKTYAISLHSSAVVDYYGLAYRVYSP